MYYKTSSSQHKPHMMYYKNQVPNLFYELKYDFTVYDQFIYDALVATISRLRFTLIQFSQLLPYIVLY